MNAFELKIPQKDSKKDPSNVARGSYYLTCTQHRLVVSCCNRTALWTPHCSHPLEDDDTFNTAVRSPTARRHVLKNHAPPPLVNAALHVSKALTTKTHPSHEMPRPKKPLRWYGEDQLHRNWCTPLTRRRTTYEELQDSHSWYREQIENDACSKYCNKEIQGLCQMP